MWFYHYQCLPRRPKSRALAVSGRCPRARRSVQLTGPPRRTRAESRGDLRPRMRVWHIIFSQLSFVSPIGFSQTMCFFAFKLAKLCSACNPFGVQILTTSISKSAARSSSMEEKKGTLKCSASYLEKKDLPEHGFPRMPILKGLRPRSLQNSSLTSCIFFARPFLQCQLKSPSPGSSPSSYAPSFMKRELGTVLMFSMTNFRQSRCSYRGV